MPSPVNTPGSPKKELSMRLRTAVPINERGRSNSPIDARPTNVNDHATPRSIHATKGQGLYLSSAASGCIGRVSRNPAATPTASAVAGTHPCRVPTAIVAMRAWNPEGRCDESGATQEEGVCVRGRCPANGRLGVADRFR